MGTEPSSAALGSAWGGRAWAPEGAAGQVSMEVTAVLAPLKPACGLTVHLPRGTSPGWSWLTHRRGRDFESRGEKTWKIGPQGRLLSETHRVREWPRRCRRKTQSSPPLTSTPKLQLSAGQPSVKKTRTYHKRSSTTKDIKKCCQGLPWWRSG